MKASLILKLTCMCMLSDVLSSDGDKKRKREVYTCPAWTNFRLDIDAVMNAMFPTTASIR